MSWGYYGFKPYVSVAQRRAQAAREVSQRKERGQKIDPVKTEGRNIATTFWGKAWCDNLESYSDFANRLPRGRTYVRNGSVVDLQIRAGKVTALVSGSELYEIEIGITALAAAPWREIKGACAGQIGSLVELLQGRLSQGVMDVVARRDKGLFPKPAEIEMSCSCPDWAGMCKHLAATLYGIGARLDRQPELLFVLRKVDHLELIASAGAAIPGQSTKKRGRKAIADSELADVFGIELASTSEGDESAADVENKPATSRRKSSRGKSAQQSAAAAAPAAEPKRADKKAKASARSNRGPTNAKVAAKPRGGRATTKRRAGKAVAR